jgi:hypothetical protein
MTWSLVYFVGFQKCPDELTIEYSQNVMADEITDPIEDPTNDWLLSTLLVELFSCRLLPRL